MFRLHQVNANKAKTIIEDRMEQKIEWINKERKK